MSSLLPRQLLATLTLASPALAQVPLFEVTDPDVPLDERIGAIGDVTGDGLPDFAVGAPHTDQQGTDSGVVRVYRGTDMAFQFEVYGDTSFDMLGASVDGAGDVNADGWPDLIAGSGRFNANLARVWSGTDAAVLHDLSGGAQDSFGWDVCGLGETRAVDGTPDARHRRLVLHQIAGQTQQLADVARDRRGLLIRLAAGELGAQIGNAVAKVRQVAEHVHRRVRIGAEDRALGPLEALRRVTTLGAELVRIAGELSHTGQGQGLVAQRMVGGCIHAVALCSGAGAPAVTISALPRQ